MTARACATSAYGRAHRRDRRSLPGLGRRDDRLPRPAHPARRHRQPGAFPRAGAGAQGRPGNGLARGGDGRRHRRLRDAQHQSADHHDGGARRQGPARPPTACIATSPSGSAARTRTPGMSPSWSGCRAPPASRCSWARRPATCWSRTTRASPRSCAHAPPRRLPFRGRVSAARAARRCASRAIRHRIRSGATRSRPCAAPSAWSRIARETGAPHPRAAHLDRRGDACSSPSTRTSPPCEVTPHHLTLDAPTTMRGSARWRR